jgi:predicted MFS family arabinose efflux permease
VAVAAVFAVHGGVAGSFATRIPWLADHLRIGPGLLGLALLAPAVGSLTAMPLVGRLVHRLGGRRLTRWLLAALCAVVALPMLAPDVPVLWLVLCAYGAAAGMCDVAMNAQAVVVERRMGRSVMSGLHGMWSVGTMVGGALGVAAARAELDARVHLASVALVLLAVGLVAGRWLPPDEPGDGSAVAPPAFTVPSRAVLLIGLIGFCAVFGEASCMDWCAVYLRTVTGSSPAVAAASYTAFTFTMAAGRLCGDAVVRRLGAVRTVRLSGLAATAGGLLVVLSPAVTSSPGPAVAGFMLIGIGVAVVVPLVFAAAGNAGPTPSEGVAGAATVSYTSGFVAPAVIGGVAAVSSLPVSFALVTVLTAGMLAGSGVLGVRAVPCAEPA